MNLCYPVYRTSPTEARYRNHSSVRVPSRTTHMPSNAAAWLDEPKSALEVRSAPYTSPRHDEIVILNGAVAINPINWIKVDPGNMVFPWLKYPCILGTDIAGEVVETDGEVTRFKVGDCVVAHAVSTGQKHKTPTKGAFQTSTVALPHMTPRIPEAMSYEEAAVMPLGCQLQRADSLN